MSDKKYDPSKVEEKWQEKWEKDKIFSPDLDKAGRPFYNLMMFPYPSAEGLHVGNMYAFTGADIYGRFQRMNGHDVFEPIGLDGFGIHSENYAFKVGKHPKKQSEISEKNFYRQLHRMGNSFDWTRAVETYDPDYYKWTQWLFVQLFKNGLAYRKKANVNWCPSDNTVLADEQVIDGKCERDGVAVEKKDLEQWFFRITKYADRLLKNIDGLDWSKKVKIAQRNWIGKSEGVKVAFRVQGLEFSYELEVFTTRPDTLYGATFMVVSPEHEIVSSIKSEEVIKYVAEAKKKTDSERATEGGEKTGVFSGLYAINPVNNKKIPVWVADYVLASYGTGAIMAVPAHDSRDYYFAQKFELEISEVIKGGNIKEEAYTGDGEIINSDSWNEMAYPESLSNIIEDLEKRGIGKREVNYHLRDWLISRQRYWGPPIPMIYCSRCADAGRSWFTTKESESHHREVSSIKYKVSSEEKIQNTKHMIHDTDMRGWYSVPEDQLPVILPDVKDWKPMGTRSVSSEQAPLRQGFEGQAVKSPLANNKEFIEVKCPGCGGDAKRETDVSDTFLDSSWYFFRYLGTEFEDVPFPSPKFRNSKLEINNSAQRTAKWLPIDMYIGGSEHAVLHLLYSRFMTMALKDLGYVDFEEPFSKFFAHGLIIKDGAKMSKSKGNVVVPDEYIDKYGVDTMRMYLMFIGPFEDGGEFSDPGIEGMNRFIKRIWRLLNAVEVTDEEDSEVKKSLHKTIKVVTEDIQQLSYNTAIAHLMEFYNVVSKREALAKETVIDFLKLISPFTPHMAEELYQSLKDQSPKIKNKGVRVFDSIHLSKWPEFDPKLVEEDEVTIVIQVNGKHRGEIRIKNGESKIRNEVEEKARNKVSKYIEDHKVKKIIYIEGKIINFVI